MSKQELETKLNSIEVSKIKSIVLRTIGLLDTFGKMLIDITYKDDTTENIEIISPVPVDLVTTWLDTNELLDRTKLYKF